MLRARLVSPGNLVVEEAEPPRPLPGEVLVRVGYCGICGSDLHAFRGTHPFVRMPVVPGHEFSGVISEVGRDVAGLAPGQKVTVEPSLVCGRCPPCTSGRYNICNDLRVMGFQAPGAFAECVAVQASKVLPLPDGVDLMEGALTEPAAVGVHAVERAGLRGRENAVVIGAGPIGLMVLQAAKAAGARVAVTDVLDRRLEVARALGADETTKPPEGEGGPEVGPGEADVVFECSGARPGAARAVHLARKGARVIVVGVFGGDVPFPLHLVQDRELEVVGTLMYRREDFERALRLMAEGRIRAGELVTHTFPLREVHRAYEFLLDRGGIPGALKVLIEV